MSVSDLEAARRRLRRRAEEATQMPDISSIELSERAAAAQLTTSLAQEIRRFVTGALFAAALAAAGTAFVTLALTIAVVGSPLIAAGIVWVIVRHHRVIPPRRSDRSAW